MSRASVAARSINARTASPCTALAVLSASRRDDTGKDATCAAAVRFSSVGPIVRLQRAPGAAWHGLRDAVPLMCASRARMSTIKALQKPRIFVLRKPAPWFTFWSCAYGAPMPGRMSGATRGRSWETRHILSRSKSQTRSRRMGASGRIGTTASRRAARCSRLSSGQSWHAKG